MLYCIHAIIHVVTRILNACNYMYNFCDFCIARIVAARSAFINLMQPHAYMQSPARPEYTVHDMYMY